MLRLDGIEDGRTEPFFKCSEPTRNVKFRLVHMPAMKSEVVLRAPINREEFGTSCQNSTANDGAFQQSDPFCFGPGRVRPTEGSAIRIHDDLAAGPSRRTVRPFGGHRMCITSTPTKPTPPATTQCPKSASLPARLERPDRCCAAIPGTLAPMSYKQVPSRKAAAKAMYQ